MKTSLASLFLVESTLRHTKDPLQNAGLKNPPGKVEMNVELVKGEEPNTFAVKLSVKVEGPDLLYSIAVTYAALLTLDPEGQDLPADVERRLMVTGSTILFPYCREVISNLTSRARFGPVWLAPANFNALLAPKTTAAVATSKTE